MFYQLLHVVPSLFALLSLLFNKFDWCHNSLVFTLLKHLHGIVRSVKMLTRVSFQCGCKVVLSNLALLEDELLVNLHCSKFVLL